jgi:hypothetical protein
MHKSEEEHIKINIRLLLPPHMTLVLPCIPNAKLANGLGLYSDAAFKFSLQILQPPFGEFLLVQRFNFDAAVHKWIMTEIAQFTAHFRCWL